jgi:hypothetical protein
MTLRRTTDEAVKNLAKLDLQWRQLVPFCTQSALGPLRWCTFLIGQFLGCLVNFSPDKYISF